VELDAQREMLRNVTDSLKQQQQLITQMHHQQLYHMYHIEQDRLKLMKQTMCATTLDAHISASLNTVESQLRQINSKLNEENDDTSISTPKTQLLFDKF